MAERTDYMREYMRDYRAAKRAAAAGGTPSRAGSARSTEPHRVVNSTPGQGQEFTEPGVYARYKWAWWLLAGVVLGLCVYGVVHTARSGTPEQRAALVAAFNDVTTEGQGDDTTEGQAADITTEPGQE